jgi:hypothetical protein
MKAKASRSAIHPLLSLVDVDRAPGLDAALRYAESQVMPLLAEYGALAMVTREADGAFNVLDRLAQLLRVGGRELPDDLFGQLEQALPEDLWDAVMDDRSRQIDAAYLLGLAVGLRLAGGVR